MNTRAVNDLTDVIHAAMKTRSTAAGIAVAVDATILEPLRAENRGHIEHAASLLRRLREEARTTWSTEVPPGGLVCADCGEPVESEPCAEHHPATVAARLRSERDQFADRVDTLTKVAKGNKAHVADLMRDLSAAQARIAELERAASPAAAPLPDETCNCAPHRKFACGHCEMDVCEDCGRCCTCDCPDGERP